MRLRLHSIDLFHVRVPLSAPISAGARLHRVKEAIIVRLQTSRGTGWGESSVPIGSEDGRAAIEACWDGLCRRIGPAMLAASDVEVEDVCSMLDRQAASTLCRTGLEMAMWHAAAMGRNVPLCALLGGVSRPIASGLCVGVQPSADELVEHIGRHLAFGYRCVKLGIRPGWDIEPVARVRQEWPDLPLAVDGGGAFCMDHLGTFRNLCKYGLTAIEQPFARDALAESAQLQGAIATPICLAGSVVGPDSVRQIAKLRAGRIIAIDIQRSGGLAQARQIHDAASKAGLTCWLETTPDLGIGAAAGLHLATLDGFGHPADVGSSSRWFADDLLEPPIVVDAGGYLHLPDGPGYGYRPNQEKVEKHTVRYETLTA